MSEASVIFAPFNPTLVTGDSVGETPQPEPRNLIRFATKVRQANRNYEFEHNKEVDNGMVIESDSKREESLGSVMDLEKKKVKEKL